MHRRRKNWVASAPWCRLLGGGRVVFACCVALLAILAPSALASPTARLVGVAAAPNGAQRVTYKVGPFNVVPGQNNIQYAGMGDKPSVDGWITRMRPDLVYTNGKVPRVDVLHLHHGVWLNMSRRTRPRPGLPERFFAAGEEKTVIQLPKGYGYDYKAADRWLLNYMIHNLTPVPAKVYMELRDRLHPEDVAGGEGHQAGPADLDGRPQRPALPGLQRQEGLRQEGRSSPTRRRSPTPTRAGKQNEWTVDRDGVLVATAGHLHPGGLHTDLWCAAGREVAKPACASRPRSARKRCKARAPRGHGSNAHLFRSSAKYFEPAGAVSWDVAMTGTRPDWRVKVNKGDTLWTSATYGTKRGSWWESMGIMVAYMADGEPGGKDPFRKRVDYAGKPTHGHLRREQQPRRREVEPARPAQAAGRPDGGRRQHRHRGLQVRGRRPSLAGPPRSARDHRAARR